MLDVFLSLAMKCSSLIDSNHGVELRVMTFRGEGRACLSSTVRKVSQNWFAFSTDEYSESLECSALNDGRSMLAMFLAVLHKVEGIETETLKHELVQYWSDSSESATVDFLWVSSSGRTIHCQSYDRTCEWAY